LIKEHRPEFAFKGLKGLPFAYENILHYICKHDNKGALTAYVDNKNFFVFSRSPLSPFLLTKMMTGDVLMKHLNNNGKFHLRDRTRIVKDVSSEEFKNLMKLNEESTKRFFDLSHQPLRYFPKHNPFKRLTA
jgi:hypothetical protein